MKRLTSLIILVAPLLVGEAVARQRLEVGQTVNDEATNVTLKFVGVERDSRCPRDVTCIVAGEALAVFEVSRDDHTDKVIFRVPPGGGDDKVLSEVTISIVELQPEAESTRKIEPTEYVAFVVISSK